jgi:hypothetical protein
MGNQQGQSGQQELPAWLESLKAGERPAAPAKSPSNFSARDLIEEGSLPNWMRPEQSGAQPKIPPSSPSAFNASSLSEPNTDEGLAGAKGFNARSLIDEQALPPWMKEGSGTGAAVSPDMSASGPAGFAASSLVQPDALPDWMKNLQQPSGPRARPSQPPTSGPLASGYGSANNAFASGAFPAQSASNAFASGAFPTQQEPLQRPMSPAQQMPPAASPLPPVPPTPTARPEPMLAPQGFSARDLLDQNALPSWMAPQGGAETAPASPMAASSQSVPPSVQAGPPAGQNGFSASSLLDMDALPPWLREGDQQKNTGAAGREPQSGFPMQSAPMNNPQGQPDGGGIAASSFIDMNALPDWLRSGIEPQQGRPQMTQMTQQPQQGVMGPASTMRPGAYPAGPQRVDNVRVPSRPRGEISQAEGSEVAANVFASMLGVASAAPNFPASSPMPSAPLGSPMPSTPQVPPASPLLSSQPMSSPLPPAQPGPSPMTSGPLGGPMPQSGMLPGANNMAGMPQSGMLPGANNMMGMPQPGMGNPQGPQGYLGVYGGAYPGNQNNQNNYAMGNPPMGSPQIPASGPGMSQMPGTGDPSAAKSARRGGLFNAIREWLFR